MGKSLMEDLVIEKLSTVYDPEVPVNIWELGLVYGIEFPKPNEVIITMTLTAPGCPIADQIVQEVHDVVLTLDGIDEVSVNLTFEPAWGPERMSEVARLELGFDI
ncbi:metal-sulfur cluster assembly factor [Butyricimonas paravirosa]|uniref:metal-sulfur cluster assembly factor n=1 Tax=Butyricimonas paravirosa TaxID=1472417 RepID=UPI00210D53D7|nr:iron-sulfur cluster assembly protein [Butyricimonas paravirosa]MCQ4875101.1 iron-sulfur cluster assembly protein [Butyricimonas paravirosa]